KKMSACLTFRQDVYLCTFIALFTTINLPIKEENVDKVHFFSNTLVYWLIIHYHKQVINS
ncbi:hypothetical protein CXF86_11130, partial [Shewanella sp. GutCb]